MWKFSFRAHPRTRLRSKLTRDKFFSERADVQCRRRFLQSYFIFVASLSLVSPLPLSLYPSIYLSVPRSRFIHLSLETDSRTASNKFSDGKFASLPGNFFAFTAENDRCGGCVTDNKYLVDIATVVSAAARRSSACYLFAS